MDKENEACLSWNAEADDEGKMISDWHCFERKGAICEFREGMQRDFGWHQML